MKRIIVTPTFRPHFPFNREFLEGYRRYAEDASDVAVHFVVTRDELDDLRAIVAEFPELALHAHAFEDLLEAAGYRGEAQELLREVGKFAYQSLKKLLALKALAYDQALVLDAEALVIKPVRMGAVFDEYFADPYVFYSDLETRGAAWFGGQSDAAVRNAAKLLKIPYPGKYFLEYYGWFYDKRLIDDLFAYFPDGLLQAIRTRLGADTRVFECQLIYSVVLANPGRYRYRLESVNALLREYLGEAEYAEYMKQFAGAHEQLGLFERVSSAVSERNLAALTRLFAERRLRFYRFEIKNLNADVQQRLIEATPVTFIASSEEYRRARERVAVCLSGEARNARQNLRFVQSFLAGSNVDVFVHFWDTPDAEYITRVLAPKAAVFEPKADAPAPPQFRRMEKNVQPTRAANSTAMFYSIKRANDLKRAYEEEHGFRYDVVVRLRLDFFTTVTLTELIDHIRLEQKGWDRVVYVPDMAQSVGLNDQIALGASDTMDTYAGAYDMLPDVAEHDYFNPEYVLLRHVLRAGLRIRTVPFEYVLLRKESASTFDLEDLVRRTRTTWWSAQLPPVMPGSMDAYFGVKAESVALVDELNLETPKVYRLRAGTRGYVRYDAQGRTLGLVPDAAAATLFYVIIPADGDRTAVNIRPRELVLGADGTQSAAVYANNLYPERDRVIRPDGPGDDGAAAFFVTRGDGGLVFEWRPGFWTTVDAARVPVPRPRGGRWSHYTEEMQSGERRILQPTRDGLALAPITPDAEPFALEYVPDPTAEAVEIGLDLAPLERLGSSADPLPVRLLYLSYVAALMVSRRGAGAVRIAAVDFLRRHAHIAERTNAPGLVNAVKRQIGKRL